MYLPRLAEKTLKKYLSIFPVVVITGPRQSGKSTLLKEYLGNSYAYVTFDKLQNIEDVNSDPVAFLKKYNNKVIFDEIQRAPQLFSQIKLLVDEDRSNYGKFILTGSSQFQIVKGITETLAGRAGNMSLLPFQYLEIPAKLRDYGLWQGGFPELVVRKYAFFTEWYESYFQNYLERDVRTIGNIGNLKDFQKFLQLLAAKAGQEFNASSYARDLGINYKTVQSWVSILEASYIIFTLEPYFNNLGKRIVKRPKLYFWDTGLVSYLTGIRSQELFEKGPLAGPLFENYLISEIYKTIHHLKKDHKLYYFRNNLGIEADLIIEDRSACRVTFVEIKYNQTSRPAMANKLKLLMEKEQELKVHPGYKICGLLLYSGKDSGKYFSSIEYLPWQDFLKNYSKV